MRHQERCLIQDFRDGSEPFHHEADLCIVGAGAAGITIARSFAGSRYRVCVVESGGLSCEADTQGLLEGRCVGEPGLYPGHSRLRVYGGSCRMWGGGCLPLAPHELLARDWIPFSGWPLDYRELEPYYQRARQACDLDDHAFAEGSFKLPGRRGSLQFDPEQLESRTFLRSAVEFGGNSLPALATAGNVHVLLHANLLELRPVPGAEHVDEALIASLDGRRGSVRSRYFVLAAGGIENARLLLLSDTLAPGGLGNARDLVGRFFQEHPRCHLGSMARGHRLDALMRGYGRPVGDRISHRELCLTSQAQREHRLLAARVRPFAVHAPASPGIQALRELRACLPRRNADNDANPVEREVAGILDQGLPEPLPPPDPATVQPARAALRIGRHLPDVTTSLMRRLRGRSHLWRDRVELVGYFEQAPNPDSRVMLDMRRDALGQRRVRIEWRLTQLDHATHRAVAGLFGAQLTQSCGGQFVPEPWVADPEGTPELLGTAHHLGTTRMADDPRHGVVDRDCRIHGIDNLYVAGSSVFPTGSWVFPTFTIIALGLRLADHLRSRLDALPPTLG